MMPKILRFGVSIEEGLFKVFDRHIRTHGYKNRSEALRDLIRNSFVREEWKTNEAVAGAILLVYDHHKRRLAERILSLQHDFQNLIVSTQHIHLDHHNCLEVIVVKGRAQPIIELHDALKAHKGIKHAALSMTTTGKKVL